MANKVNEKNNERNKKIDVYRILLILSTVIFVILGIYTSTQKKIYDIDVEGYTKVKSVNSGVQRITKLELEDTADDYLTALLYYVVLEIRPLDTPQKYFANSPEILEIIDDFVDDFMVFLDAVTDFNNDISTRDVLFWASEVNYENSIDIAKEILTYIREKAEYITNLDRALTMNLIFIALLLVKMLHVNVKELQRNKQLSKEMQIDIDTGLYDRSKCQEVLQSLVTPANRKEKAVVIFDINDLGLVNELDGKSVGDTYISTFANYIKEATNLFPDEVFVARYGDDEFMTYFGSVDETDIKVYLGEIRFLVDRFNETKNESKNNTLTYAYGYSITTKETKAHTMRDLLDEAEKKMRDNKFATKKIINIKHGSNM